ncbi:SDR family NAD(P)-dependent oxidoreductase [Benzoatithermus flavus]|uniref:SDR family oxidoreductase n=1 Tax=Benzoatithermus flavus TaxID=3108223 RepID=A0ABU8XXJ0_9PROT
MTGWAIYPSLKGRSVFVTGGGSGIGAQIVRRFCEQGSKVAFVDIDRSASEALVHAVAGEGMTAPLFIPCDLRDIERLRAAIREAADANGPITVLVNNAARDDRHAAETVTPEYWDERFAVNLRHQFFAAQAVHAMMKQAGGGSIINMGSTSWMIGQGGMAAYTAAKSAVLGLTRSLARDWGPDNIRVTSIAPGWIMTERQQQLWLTPEGEKELMARQCLKRKLYPDDIARVVLFLAADDSSAMTNQSYIVDGGWV